MVVKMVLDAFYYLVVLMPFACHQNDIPCLRQCTGSLDRRSAVFNHQSAAQFIFRQAGFHVVQNICGGLVTGIIRCQNQLFAPMLGYLCHHGAFAFVPVAAATDHRNQSWLLTFDYL